MRLETVLARHPRVRLRAMARPTLELLPVERLLGIHLGNDAAVGPRERRKDIHHVKRGDRIASLHADRDRDVPVIGTLRHREAVQQDPCTTLGDEFRGRP